MTAEEAKQALKEGKKVRCTQFEEIRYLEKGGCYLNRNDEDHELLFENFEDDDWEIIS